MMEDTLIPEALSVELYPSTCFRVCVGNPQFPDLRPYGLRSAGSIVTEDPFGAVTWRIARHHLRWNHEPTPFISVFSNSQRALSWAKQLERKGLQGIYIVVIDTYTVPKGQLWDAHQIARELGFSEKRLRYHENELLFRGWLDSERILAVLPAIGPLISLKVHLWLLTLPRSFLEAIGSRNTDLVKEELFTEIYVRFGVWDEVRLQQTIFALCTTRLG
jgi:hypothetical protein